MFVKFVALFAFAALTSASDFTGFSYSVADPYTGDFKHQIENRLDNNVQGQYSLLEADGTRRTVDYAAGAEGFNAVVSKTPGVISAPIIASHSIISPAIASPVISYASPISIAKLGAITYASPFPYTRLH